MKILYILFIMHFKWVLSEFYGCSTHVGNQEYSTPFVCSTTIWEKKAKRKKKRKEKGVKRLLVTCRQHVRWGSLSHSPTRLPRAVRWQADLPARPSDVLPLPRDACAWKERLRKTTKRGLDCALRAHTASRSVLPFFFSLSPILLLISTLWFPWNFSNGSFFFCKFLIILEQL